MARSRLDQIWQDHLDQYRRLDDLEKRIDEHAVRLRRRITNVLETTPTHRLSHLRLFVSHEERTPQSEAVVVVHAHPMAAAPSKKWTLKIEGRLLIGHLDHASARAFDERLRQDFARRYNVTSKNHSSMTLATSEPSASQTCPTEDEEAIKEMKFTHFFDKMVCQFQSLYQTVDMAAASATKVAAEAIAGDPKIKQQQQLHQQQNSPMAPGAKETASSETSNSRNKKKSRTTKRQKTAAEAEEQAALDEPKKLVYSDPKEFVWNKAITTISPNAATSSSTITTQDADAFMVHYDSPAPPARDLKLYGAIATVQLYPSRGPVQRYKPSKDFAKAFFPKHHSDILPPLLPTVAIAEAKLADQKELEAGGEGSGESTPLKSLSKKRSALTPVAPTIPAHQLGLHALENEMHVPTSLSMEEILVSLFTYIQDRKLVGAKAAAGSVLEVENHSAAADDPTLIHNDATLKALFQCDTMHFHDIPNLLTQHKLILLLPKPPPIVLKYVLRAAPTADVNNVMDVDVTTTATEEASAAAPMTMDLHNDVYVPNLFPSRARELLRRIKRREVDYTASRTKARYLLMACRAKDEGVVKEKLENAICGTTIGEWPVLACLAKAAPPHSESRVTAQCDARIAYLLEQVEKYQQAAHDAWELVEWFRTAASVDEEDKDAHRKPASESTDQAEATSHPKTVGEEAITSSEDVMIMETNI